MKLKRLNIVRWFIEVGICLVQTRRLSDYFAWVAQGSLQKAGRWAGIALGCDSYRVQRLPAKSIHVCNPHSILLMVWDSNAY